MAVSSHAGTFNSHLLFWVSHRYSRFLALRHRFCYTTAKSRKEFILLRHEHEFPRTKELLHKDIKSRQFSLLFTRQFSDSMRNNGTFRRPSEFSLPSVPREARCPDKSNWIQLTKQIRDSKKSVTQGLVELETLPPVKTAQKSSQPCERPYENFGVDEISTTSCSHSTQVTTSDIGARFTQLDVVEELYELDANDLEHAKEDTGATRKACPATGLSSERELNVGLLSDSSHEKNDVNGKPSVANDSNFLVEGQTDCEQNLRIKLCSMFDKVIVVDNVTIARKVVYMLTHQYRHLVYACDTKVSKINVKLDTPVDHGEVICFSIYSGEDVNYGNGRSCIWVDVLDGHKDILAEFAAFF